MIVFLLFAAAAFCAAVDALLSRSLIAAAFAFFAAAFAVNHWPGG